MALSSHSQLIRNDQWNPPVMIGMDLYKGSHTAFVIDGREKQLGQLPPGSRHARPERSG